MSGSSRVDLNASGVNMFGILPCPRCASVYRWPHQDGRLICDDCRYEEQGDFTPAPAASTENHD
jgi:hypothetical protein